MAFHLARKAIKRIILQIYSGRSHLFATSHLTQNIKMLHLNRQILSAREPELYHLLEICEDSSGTHVGEPGSDFCKSLDSCGSDQFMQGEIYAKRDGPKGLIIFLILFSPSLLFFSRILGISKPRLSFEPRCDQPKTLRAEIDSNAGVPLIVISTIEHRDN